MVEEGHISPAALEAARGDPANHFGRYVRVALLGSGAMADVWLACDTKTQREVALKLLMRASAEDRQRLMKGAQAARVLSHPAIANVFEIGSAGGSDYIAVEYIRGIPLSRRGVTLAEAARVVQEAASAVHEAHIQGILHRDLKPANIFVDEGRQVHVTDFGVPRSTSIGGRSVTGTPSYVAPEEVRGSRAQGERVDIYALGATLYELVTGEAPFAGGTEQETLEKVLRGDLIPPRAVQPRVPVALEAIVLKAMARDPERRYVSASELAEDLRRFLAGQSVSACVQSQRPRKILVGVAICLLLGVSAWVFVPKLLTLRDSSGSSAEGRRAFAEAQRCLDRAETARREGNREGALDQFRQAQEHLDRAVGENPDDGVLRVARARVRRVRALARGMAVTGALEDLDHVMARGNTSPEVRFLRACLQVEEFEWRVGGGVGVHFALGPTEGVGGTTWRLLCWPRGELPGLMRMMQELHEKIRDDLAASGERVMGRALDAFLLGAFSEAEQHAKTLVETDRYDDAAWALYLCSMEAAGAYQRGLAATEEGLRRFSGESTLHMHKAVCSMALSGAKGFDAEPACNAAVRLEPDHASARALQAVLRALRNDASGAHLQLRKLETGAGSDSSLLRWARATVLRVLGRTDEALEDFGALVKVSRSPLLLYERAGTCRRRGDWGWAIQDLEAVCRELPGFEGAILELAEARDLSGETGGALTEFQALAQKAQDPVVRASALENVGLLLWAQGEEGRAFESLVAAAQGAPREIRRWRVALDSAAMDESWDRMLEIARAWIQKDARSALAHLMAAQAHLQRKEYKEGLEMVARAESLGMTRASVLDIRAELYRAMGELEKALQDIEALLALGSSAGGRPRQLRILLEMGEYGRVETEARKWLAGIPQTQKEACGMAQAYVAAALAGRGVLDEALALLGTLRDAGALTSAFLEEKAFASLRERPEFVRVQEAVQEREEEERKEVTKRPFLGVSGAAEPGVSSTGVLVRATVKQMGARRAGIRAGDRIVRFDGTTISTWKDLTERIVAKRVGDVVRLRIERGEGEFVSTFERDVTLGHRVVK